jgi:hypothetical protein
MDMDDAENIFWFCLLWAGFLFGNTQGWIWLIAMWLIGGLFEKL